MTKEELNEIKARAEAATPGPWDIGHEAPPLYASNQDIVASRFCKIIFLGNKNFDLYRDARFIARARQDIPALVAEVERLQNALYNIRDLAQDNIGRCVECGEIYNISDSALKGDAK